MTNEKQHNGRSVFPVSRRVMSANVRLGSGWHLKLRKSDGTVAGTVIDIPDSAVMWENETTADVVVGDPRPEFASDPQGGAAGNQFLWFLAAAPPSNGSVPQR